MTMSVRFILPFDFFSQVSNTFIDVHHVYITFNTRKVMW